MKSLKDLLEETVYDKSINGFKTYLELQQHYASKGDLHKSNKAQQIYYRNSYINPIKHICTNFSEEGNSFLPSQLDLLPISSFRKHIEDVGYEFITSYTEVNNNHLFNNLDDWRNILHLHIPKCAGTTFEHSLTTLYHKLTWENSARKFKDNKQFFIQHGNYDSKNYDRLVETITEAPKRKYQGLFLVAHGASWRKILVETEQLINSSIKVICPVREPLSRLRSHIRMVTAHCSSLSEARIEINKNKAILYNSIVKFIHDKSLYGSYSSFSSDLDPNENIDERIIFLNYSDSESLNSIKQAHISACKLPNIVHPKILNNKNNRDNLLSDNLIENLCEEALLDNACAVDIKLNIERLVHSSKEKIITAKQNETQSPIHPLTFVNLGISQYAIVPTKDLFMNAIGFQKFLRSKSLRFS